MFQGFQPPLGLFRRNSGVLSFARKPIYRQPKLRRVIKRAKQASHRVLSERTDCLKQGLFMGCVSDQPCHGTRAGDVWILGVIAKPRWLLTSCNRKMSNEGPRHRRKYSRWRPSLDRRRKPLSRFVNERQGTTRFAEVRSPERRHTGLS
jgi:hypothetical protein